MGKRILVVDDDLPLRSAMQDLLENEGYEVDTAADGLEALERLDQRQNMYDTILLDLKMPHMDGLQLLREVQQQGLVSLNTIIVLSGDMEALQQVASQGICGTLMKPFELETLLSRITYSSVRDCAGL